MLKNKRNIILLVSYIVISCIIVTLLGNITPFSNRINKYKNASYDKSSIVFFDWIYKDIDNIYLSGNDPQLTLNNLNCYVNDIRLYLNTDEQNLNPQIFLKTNTDDDFLEKNSMKFMTVKYNVNGYYSLEINKEVESLRIDLFDQSNIIMKLERIEVNSYSVDIEPIDYLPNLIGLVILILVLLKKDYFKIFMNYRILIISLATNDLKSRYAGSVLGIFWAFVQPVMTIIVMWFVFQIGFRNPPINNIEFILWFICGYIPWMYFNDGVISVTSALQEYSYLVKKINFKIEILPIIKGISSLIIHLFFIGFIFVMFAIYKHYPSIIWIQVLYYSFALTILLFGMSLLFSSLSVFMKDFSQVIGVVLQLLFWLTPIVWSPENMEGTALKIIKLNPLYYVVQGYRDTFINNVYVWEHPVLTSYYWVFTIIIIIVGVIVFKKLKPHFSDLL